MLYNFCFWFIMFILYSIIGYVAEIINLTIMTRKPVWNRGFLIGPYLPIYGVGCIFMVFGLNKYGHDLFAIFIIAAFFCTLLEYFTSLIMEKIFGLITVPLKILLHLEKLQMAKNCRFTTVFVI